MLTAYRGAFLYRILIVIANLYEGVLGTPEKYFVAIHCVATKIHFVMNFLRE